MVWGIWTLAGLMRSDPKKPLPKMDSHLSEGLKKNTVESLSGDDIMASLRVYQSKRDKKKATK